MSVFESPSYAGHERVVFHADAATGLRAIIAVHNTQLGPAVGGCRYFPYLSESDAIEDVLRLSSGMTYKSALAGLPMGGGKAVIIGNPKSDKTPALLRSMGRLIDSLGGLYITAEDSGTCVADMKVIATETPYVSGLQMTNGVGGDPSPYTALGVFHGIEVAVKHQLGKASLGGTRVAVQGAGAVGRHLIRLLLAQGADVWVSDINAENLQAALALGAHEFLGDSILAAEVDVLAPCAMGAVINDTTLNRVRAPIIAGAANNQLAEPRHGRFLAERGILYVPDFVINAGGIIAVHHERIGSSELQVEAHVRSIASTLERLFERSAREGCPTDTVAVSMATERLELDSPKVARAIPAG